jgi:hypothetical protein
VDQFAPVGMPVVAWHPYADVSGVCGLHTHTRVHCAARPCWRYLMHCADHDQLTTPPPILETNGTCTGQPPRLHATSRSAHT